MLKLNGKASLSTIAGLGIAAFLVSAPVAMSAQPEIPAGAGISSWVENGAGGRYLLQVQKGTMPEAGQSVVGTVLSDSDCAPDEDGINHCRNEIQLPDGSILTGIDNHRMSVNPCLSPDDKVTVSQFSDGWALILTEEAQASN